jgi:hypothetical protein
MPCSSFGNTVERAPTMDVRRPMRSPQSKIPSPLQSKNLVLESELAQRRTGALRPDRPTAEPTRPGGRWPVWSRQSSAGGRLAAAGRQATPLPRPRTPARSHRSRPQPVCPRLGRKKCWSSTRRARRLRFVGAAGLAALPGCCYSSSASWGRSSVGRALAWHARGSGVRFSSPPLDVGPGPFTVRAFVRPGRGEAHRRTPCVPGGTLRVLHLCFQSFLLHSVMRS